MVRRTRLALTERTIHAPDLSLLVIVGGRDWLLNASNGVLHPLSRHHPNWAGTGVMADGTDDTIAARANHISRERLRS